ncbi:MAG: single-stranded-DNA-specific exonuclease RecJ [Minisyncoccota bacterium]
MSVMHFPQIFESLINARGILPELLEDFLRPNYDKLHDPLLLPDMEKARDRVIKAMQNNEHIVVFSDYDADGIPGAVVLADFFKRAKYENVSFYIPHRHDEGFGLNMEAMDEIAERGAKLMITVDCGTADIKEIASANKKGIDVIITDHHESDKLPKAYAIVNPKIKKSEYPFKELCGATLAYKLVQAILQKERFGIKEGMEKWSLDMVGIATLSDMVPLVGENRVFAKYGLDVLRKSPRPGLSALFKKINLDQKHLTEDDVTFMITPRINAASRMGKPEDAFNLLATTDQNEAEILAEHLEKINNERKGIVASLVKDAKKHLEAREKINSVIVVGNPEWRPSLLGLVANSLVEEYMRPAFVWGRDGDNVLKGSCRSYNGYNLFDLMNGAKDSFLEFGGHAGAGGFSATLEQIVALEDSLSRALQNLSQIETKEGNNDKIQIELKDINENLWQTVSMLAPFGMGNPKPVFHISNAEIRSAKNFGKTGDHLEIVFSNGTKAISFFNTIENTKTPLVPGTPITLTAHLEKSYFRNRPEVRLRIVEIMA